jgi:predicted patatin/cPLA2 family phospholipase
MTKSKVAFVASGGGISCAYGAGVAWALQDAGIRPDILIGSSGSAGTVSYFACGEAERAARLWIEEVTNPRVLQRKPVRLDVDFVINSMRDRFPFDQKKLHNAETELFLKLTDYETLETRYVSNHEMFDWYEVMRASMAIPFVYGKQILLDGRLYFDGDVSASFQDSMAFAQEKGATTIYVCDTRSKDSFFQNVRDIGLRALFTLDFIKTLRGLIKMHRSNPSFEGVRVVHFQPSEEVESKSMENDLKVIRQAIERGYAETSAALGKTH